MSKCVRVEVFNDKSYTDSREMDFMIKQLKKKSLNEGLFGDVRKNRDFHSKKTFKKVMSIKRLKRFKKLQEIRKQREKSYR